MSTVGMFTGYMNLEIAGDTNNKTNGNQNYDNSGSGDSNSTNQGATGTWELVVDMDTNTIVHFLFNGR